MFRCFEMRCKYSVPRQKFARSPIHTQQGILQDAYSRPSLFRCVPCSGSMRILSRPERARASMHVREIPLPATGHASAFTSQELRGTTSWGDPAVGRKRMLPGGMYVWHHHHWLCALGRVNASPVKQSLRMLPEIIS